MLGIPTRRMAETLPLSLVVITRDAARELPGCLASAPFAAEAIVVDSGSRDDTVETARRCGARVVSHPWQGFGPQKAFAVAQATHDWVLCLDADERVTPELAAAIQRAFDAGPPSAPAFEIARRNRFLGRWLAHGEGYPDWIVRLFDRRHARWTDDPVAPCHAETLLSALAPGAGLVTVLDGSPGALSWLGGVKGMRVSPLGTDRFGQTGDLPDLYRSHRLDTDAIVEATAELFLGD